MTLENKIEEATIKTFADWQKLQPAITDGLLIVIMGRVINKLLNTYDADTKKKVIGNLNRIWQ